MKGDGSSVRSLLRVFNRQPLAAKVPEVTALFWVIKISTTAAGEAISDMFVNNKELGVVVEVSMFCVALVLQFAARRYSAIPYWFLALAIATAGTGVADTMHLVFGMPYAVTSLFWLIVLGVVFFLWNRTEHTLDIHSITTSRREKYYWCVSLRLSPSGPPPATLPHRRSASATSLGLLLLRRDPRTVGRLEVPALERHFFVLVRLRDHPAGRRIVRRLLQQGSRRERPDLGDWQTALVLTTDRGRARRLHGTGPLRHPDARGRDRRRHLTPLRRLQSSTVTMPKRSMRARSSSGDGGWSRCHNTWRLTK